MALYTDGLIEAPGGDLDQRIAACARALDSRTEAPPRTVPALDGLIDTLLDSPPADFPHNDDIAVLLLRRATPTAS